MSRDTLPDPNSFEARFPNVAGWAQDGWIELGPTDWSRSFIRVMDEGGLVWEGKTKYSSIDDAFADAEQVIEAWHNGDL